MGVVDDEDEGADDNVVGEGMLAGVVEVEAGIFEDAVTGLSDNTVDVAVVVVVVVVVVAVVVIVVAIAVDIDIIDVGSVVDAITGDIIELDDELGIVL
jgi:hypothetical protein